MCDYIDFAVFIDDIDILIEAIQMVGEAYLDFDNIANAFFAFREMVSQTNKVNTFRWRYANELNDIENKSKLIWVCLIVR